MKVFSVIFSLILCVVLVWFVIDSIKTIVQKIRVKKQRNKELNENKVVDTQEPRE